MSSEQFFALYAEALTARSPEEEGEEGRGVGRGDSGAADPARRGADGVVMPASGAIRAPVLGAVGGVVMVGLHTCGDLTPTMLRVFRSPSTQTPPFAPSPAAASPEEAEASLQQRQQPPPRVTAIVNVGCCYNLLSEPRQVAPQQP